MARKPNYGFDKRRKELERKQRTEAKQQRRQEEARQRAEQSDQPPEMPRDAEKE